ncbi:protein DETOXIFICATION 12 isoform X2 [Amborella trichopoda]|nr:protein DETOXIFICATION 12 isoform X2 [Amborella trichopoda]|eukprot:XP_020522734.1 protein DETOXIFICATION 12 isoform X2 [Amborella trichopoda]
MASALETLCGQAYGAEQYQEVGIYTQRAAITLSLVCIPMSFIWASMSKILSLIGQDPAISAEAGRYIVWLIPGLFAFALLQPLVKFLQAQSITMPMLLSSTATLCLHVPLCWALVFPCQLGSIGAAMSMSITTWANVLMLGCYIKFSPKCKRTLAPLSKEAFRGLGEFFRLAFPSATMICLEYWSFELLVLLSGLLPNPKLETSVLSICLSTLSLLYSIPYGLGAAASTRISNELGAGCPQEAALVVRVVMAITLTEALSMSVIVFVARYLLGYAFSNEEEVVKYVARMAPLFSASTFMDGIQGVLSGVARGCGWQHIGAYINLGAFYLVGIPAALVLGFIVQMRGMGLWIGILCGATVQTVLLALITLFTNWQHQANKARERVFQNPAADALLH